MPEAAAAVEEEVNLSPLNMTDEEMLEYVPPEEGAEPAPEPKAEEPQPEKDPEPEVEVPEVAPEVDTPPEVPSVAKAPETPPEGLAEPPTPSTEVDYKAEYDKLMAPFKANNKTMQVSSVEDALTLMKMGANYNKKMANLKPNLRIVKMLEKHDLLDEQKLNYLIELDKKKPEAIGKLVKDSGVDPLDIDIDSEKTAKYTPATYNVDDSEVELDGILDDMRDTDSYSTLMDIVGNKWDEASRVMLLGNPTLLPVLNDQVASGIYDQVNGVVENERMLGRLAGLSDIDAYKAVGEYMQKNGLFKTAAANVVADPTPTQIKAKVDPKLSDQKRAASTVKSAPAKQAAASGLNPLNMSDAEFEKMASEQFI